jgi:hypothetical protein
MGTSSRLAVCGTLRHPAGVTQQNLRTANYAPEARDRLGKAVSQARRAIGHRFRRSFADETGLGIRSIEALERGEPTVGVVVAEQVGRTLGRHIRGWHAGSAEAILNGGPIPEFDLVDSGESSRAKLDVVWANARRELTAVLVAGADAETYLRKFDHWHGRFKKVGLNDTDLISVSKEAQQAARREKG